MLDIYVAGINQNSDKIYVSAGLTAVMQSLGYSSAIYKPIETGAFERSNELISPNLAFVKFIDPYIKTYSTYLLKDKSVPLISAAFESISIDNTTILKNLQKAQALNEVLIVEGSYGLGTPLNKNFLEEDMIKMFEIPVLFTASAQNDSIDSILLSINHAKDIKLSLRGIILLDYSNNTDNIKIKILPKLIKEYTDIDTLGTLPSFERNINPNDLINEILNGINIEQIFDTSIPKL